MPAKVRNAQYELAKAYLDKDFPFFFLPDGLSNVKFTLIKKNLCSDRSQQTHTGLQTYTIFFKQRISIYSSSAVIIICERYMPRQKPNVMLFPVAGVHLASHGTNCSHNYCKVRLQKLTRDHSGGAYRCEISSEAPAFRLASETHNVTVAVFIKQ
ncbi:hypothetical protein NQ318_020488 [Aromia moschata]|uniref:Uncharacterized protein n=1 Tax=Aromia moschata TaxID=1265417 RepID=A0AAV8YDE8_9CUCU|nr:hypothetical protein NQ318_020488 [Aromia moschata]